MFCIWSLVLGLLASGLLSLVFGLWSVALSILPSGRWALGFGLLVLVVGGEGEGEGIFKI